MKGSCQNVVCAQGGPPCQSKASMCLDLARQLLLGRDNSWIDGLSVVSNHPSRGRLPYHHEECACSGGNMTLLLFKASAKHPKSISGQAAVCVEMDWSKLFK